MSTAVFCFPAMLRCNVGQRSAFQLGCLDDLDSLGVGARVGVGWAGRGRRVSMPSISIRLIECMRMKGAYLDGDVCRVG